MIKDIQDPNEKSSKLQQLLDEINNKKTNIEKLFIEILDIIDCNDIDTLIKLTDCVELDTLKIEKIINKLNVYIKNNKNKEDYIYKKDLVENIQTKIINFLGNKKCNHFELWNNILKNQNINNPEIMVNFCKKFNNNIIKAKKRDKIILSTSFCVYAITSAIPIINYIFAPIALGAVISSAAIMRNHYDDHQTMLNKMLGIFSKIKIDNKNINDMSDFQSELVKTTLNVHSVEELDILVKNINFSLNNIESDLQMMEKDFKKIRLKELYESSLEQINETTEKYFLKKLKEYNSSEINKKSSSQAKKEVKALLMAIISKEKYEQISDEFKNEVNTAMKNIVKGKIRLFSGPDKQTYNKAKELFNSIENNEYVLLDTRKEPTSEISEKSNNTTYLSKEEISYNETTLLNLERAGGGELDISKNQAQLLELK